MVAISAIAASPAVMAAKEPSAEGSRIEEEPDTVVNLAEVSIISNRATAKTPVAFTNVSKEKLTSANDGRDLPFLIAATPSVVTTSDAGTGTGYSSMRIRGTDASRINITANGIPINDAESHNVYWVNMPDLASSLRSVQIQRGAGTSTNGAGAFGASVNMITDNPSRLPYAELSGAYGMYNTNRETLRVGTGLIGDHLTADLRLSHIGSDGYIDRATSQLWSYFGQLAYLGDDTVVKLIAFGGKEKTYMAWDYASKEDMEKYGRRYNPCGEYTDDDGKTAYYPNQYDNFIQHHFQLHFSRRLSEKWNLGAALHYTYDNGYYDQYKTRRSLQEYGLVPFLNADGDLVTKSDLVRLKYNRNDFGGGLFSINYKDGGWDVTIGGAANNFKGNHFGQVAWVRNYVGPINPLQEYYRNTGRKFDGNVYLRANYDINNQWSAFADLQYRYIHYTIDGISDNWDWNAGAMSPLDVDRHWNFFNPKVGINYTSGVHRAFASWSVAHKEPTRDNFVDGDRNFPPQSERLFDYELGYVFASQMFSASVNLYYMDYKDQLVATGQLSDTGNMLTVNTPDSYRTGVELQGDFRPCEWFDWQANATLSRNRIQNFKQYIYENEESNPIVIDRGDTPISFSPDFIFNNIFSFSYRGFDAAVNTKFVSRQYMDNAGTESCVIDSYCVTDLNLAYSVPVAKLGGIKELKVGFFIYNIFNRKYFNNGYCGTGYYLDNGKPEIYTYAGYAAQAPTHVMTTLTFKF